MICLIIHLLKMTRTDFWQKNSNFCTFWRKILAKIPPILGKTRIYVAIWFGGGSVDRTLWFGGSAEPHRTTKFGRTRSRSRTVRSFTIRILFENCGNSYVSRSTTKTLFSLVASLHCLQVTLNVSFEFWHCSPIFVILKVTCLVTHWPKIIQNVSFNFFNFWHFPLIFVL